MTVRQFSTRFLWQNRTMSVFEVLGQHLDQLMGNTDLSKGHVNSAAMEQALHTLKLDVFYQAEPPLYTVVVDAPGVQDRDVRVILTPKHECEITLVRKFPHLAEAGEWHLAEHDFGRSVRTFKVGNTSIL
jgi:hypothetical protein